MNRAACVLILALGCASRPAMVGVGQASPPGRHRTEGPARAPRPEPAPPSAPTIAHAPSDPIPRFDDPPPVVAEARTEPAESAEDGPSSAAGDVWEDPSGRAAVFLQSVRARTIPLTVVQLGDSHTEGDAWTGALRRALVRRLGDGGRGFVPVAGAQRDVTRVLEGQWQVLRSGLRTVDGPMGLGLSRAVSRSAGATLRVTPRADAGDRGIASRVTVFYRALPEGGTLVVRVGDGVQRVSTRTGDHVSVVAPGGVQAVSVSPAGDGPVEVFGVALDREGAGARVESAGIIGAQASHLLREHWPTLAAQLAARGPTLVALAFGTNESVAGVRAPEVYARALTTLIASVRAAVPGVTIAVFGPTDAAVRAPAGGGYVAAPRLEEVIAAGRAVARAEGALFVDVAGMMRAAGGVQAWVDARPALAEPDHVHLTRRGYEALAESMARALLDPEAAP